MNLNDLKRALAAEAGFLDPDAAKRAGVCCRCCLPAETRCVSDADKREYRISGLCGICFDEITEEDS